MAGSLCFAVLSPGETEILYFPNLGSLLTQCKKLLRGGSRRRMHMASDPNIWGNPPTTDSRATARPAAGSRGNEIESCTEQIAPLPPLRPHLARSCPRSRPVVPSLPRSLGQ